MIGLLCGRLNYYFFLYFDLFLCYKIQNILFNNRSVISSAFVPTNTGQMLNNSTKPVTA